MSSDIANDNSGLLYEYTEKLFKAKADNIDYLNNRIAGLIVASTGLLKLASDLPVCNSLGTILRAVIILIISSSIFCCILGVKPGFTGSVADPRELCTPEYRIMNIAKLRFIIILFWLDSIDEFDRVIDLKLTWIKRSVFCLFGSIALYALIALAR